MSKEKKEDNGLCEKCGENPKGTIGHLKLCRVCAGKEIVKQKLLRRKTFVWG